MSIHTTFLANQSSIIKMSSAEVSHSNTTMRTVYESLLPVVAQQVIQPDWACALSKCGIVEGKTTHWVESKLSAGNSGIKCAPESITDGPPGLIDTDFYSSLQIGGAIHKTQISKTTYQGCIAANSYISKVEAICSVSVVVASQQSRLCSYAGSIVNKYWLI
jgi:hypothetical protein